MIDKENIQIIRDIRIHKILNIPDNGRDIRIPCPIHGGKNPNFIINSDNSYHCFKCNKHGSGAIDFCLDLGYSFKDSLNELIKYI